MEYADYLVHHGILGMHWGIRRFQNRDGSLTAAGRKRAGVGEKTGNARHKPSNAKKLAKQRIAALEKARKARAEKKEFETNKKNALERGNASEVLKFKGSLSNQELQTALTRINLEKQLSQIATADTKSTWDKINSATDKMGRMINLTNKGIDAWNVFAKISNSFSENKLPTIGGDNKKDDPNAKLRDKILADYAAKSGNLDQVLKYASNMDMDVFKSAIDRLTPKDDVNAKERDKMLADYAAKSGNLDQVLKYASNMKVSEFKSALDRLSPKDDASSRERDRVLADYAAKNGTFDQVVKYAPQMSTTTLGEALSRFVPKDPDVSEATRQKMIRDYIIDFGSSKNVISIIKDLTSDEIERARKAQEKKNKKDEDDDS